MNKSHIISLIVVLFLGQLFVYVDSFSGFDIEGILSGLYFFIGGLVFYLLLFFLMGKFTKKSNKIKLPETDERIEQNGLKFMAQMFGLSHLIAASLCVFFMITDQNVIQIEYVLYYIVTVLFLTMIIGSSIVRKL